MKKQVKKILVMLSLLAITTSAAYAATSSEGTAKTIKIKKTEFTFKNTMQGKVGPKGFYYDRNKSLLYVVDTFGREIKIFEGSEEIDSIILPKGKYYRTLNAEGDKLFILEEQRSTGGETELLVIDGKSIEKRIIIGKNEDNKFVIKNNSNIIDELYYPIDSIIGVEGNVLKIKYANDKIYEFDFVNMRFLDGKFSSKFINKENVMSEAIKINFDGQASDKMYEEENELVFSLNDVSEMNKISMNSERFESDRKKETDISYASSDYDNKMSAYNRAMAYTSHKWTYDSSKNSNNNNGTFIYDLPEHILGISGKKEITGVPYCWGGWSKCKTLYQFDQTIESGYQGGRVSAASGSGYASGTAGIDCSGLVMVAFDMNPKYKLNDVGIINDKYCDFISKDRKEILEEAQFMDILDRYNRHIIMVVAADSNGVFVIESAGGSKDRCQTSYYSYDSLYGYKLYRYKF